MAYKMNAFNTNLSDLRAAWARDWDRLVRGAEVSGGGIRHIFNDRPEKYDSQRWELICRRDYRNIADWYGLEPLETEHVLETWPAS